jgi:hypothetical protein
MPRARILMESTQSSRDCAAFHIHQRPQIGEKVRAGSSIMGTAGVHLQKSVKAKGRAKGSTRNQWASSPHD